MNIVHNGRYYEIQFDFNPRILSAIKAIEGRRWNPTEKVWMIPVEQQKAVEELQRRFCKVNPTTQVPEEIGVLEEMPELDIELPLKVNPYPYQRRGIAYNLKYKRVIVGDEPGLGKTLQAIATAVASGAQCILVICPSSLKENWVREFDKFAGYKGLVMADKIKTTWPTYNRVAGVKVFITNYESLKKYFVDKIVRERDEQTGKEKPLRLNHIHFKEEIKLFDFVIIDELHRLKDGSSQQSKYTMGITRGKEWVLGLTGTPVVNKPKDLVAQLHIVNRLMDMGGYKYFIDRYCGGNGSGATNLRELSYKLKSTCFYQRKKKEVLTELPDKMRQVVITDITNRTEYDRAINDLASYLQQYKQMSAEDIDKSLRGEIMVQIGVCKAISARGKIDMAVEHINEVIESGEKIGVFIHQKEIAQALKAKYPDALTITGSDSMEARQAAVDKFQNDPNAKVILLSIKAAGVGLTLTASSRCLFIELPWHPADCDQCEDRFHRIGQKNSVQAAYLIGKDTIDEKIYQIIEKKRAIANDVLGVQDNIQKEIIDMVMGSLFNKKAA